MKLLRYDNITEIDPQKWGPKTYQAVAVYSDGSTMSVCLSELNLKEYQLTQRLKGLKVEKETFDLVHSIVQLAYEEGRTDAQIDENY